MRKFQSILAILLLLVIVVVFDNACASNNVDADTTTESKIEEVVFPHDEVVDVNIIIDEEVYNEMIENAMDEEYVMADIIYNGYEFSDVAIRPKGNSSLKSVAQSESERLSYKVDFNYYLEDQNFFGLKKINLNNIFSDDTLMAEYLGYEMLEDLDAAFLDTTYVSLSINGELHGLYLAVEQVDDVFLEETYGDSNGELYKPEMGAGSDLSYISDDPEAYTGIYPKDENDSTDENFVNLVKTIDEIVINNGESDEYKLDEVINMDSLLKYLALSTVTIHMDTYQSGMNHNYYLYFNEDTELYEWISWDLNMIFNGYPSGLTDEEAIQFLIDEPVMGEMSKYPLIEAVFMNEEYVDKYHEYIQTLVDGYLSEDHIEERVLEIYQMIEPYASIDPTAFFTIQEVKESLFSDEENTSLLTFISERNKNIVAQLNGTISSTNNGLGNTGSSSPGKGQNKPMDRGQNVPTDAERVAPDAAERVAPDAAERVAPDDAERVAPDDAERVAPDDAERVAPDAAERVAPDDAAQNVPPERGNNPQMGMPPQVLEWYENGMLTEELENEINAYLESGEIPPVDFIEKVFESMGEELPAQGGQNDRMAPPMEGDRQDGEVSINNVVDTEQETIVIFSSMGIIAFLALMIKKKR